MIGKIKMYKAQNFETLFAEENYVLESFKVL
jgi:hypothetical protein